MISNDVNANTGLQHVTFIMDYTGTSDEKVIKKCSQSYQKDCSN